MARYESLTEAREDIDHCDRCEFCDGCKVPASLCEDAVCDHCGDAFTGDAVADVNTHDGEMLCKVCTDGAKQQAAGEADRFIAQEWRKDLGDVGVW